MKRTQSRVSSGATAPRRTNNTLLCKFFVLVCLLMASVGVWAQTLTQGKPYALYSANKGTRLYLDPETSNQNTINGWSDKCILYFTPSSSNSSYYSIKNKNGYYASGSTTDTWSMIRTDNYSASTCDLRFIPSGTNYYLRSIRNTNRYLGVDNTNAGSPLYYDKTTGNNSRVVLWTLYSVYSVSISGNPSPATATIGGQTYNHESYYLTTSQTVDANSITPSNISGYQASVVVNDALGTISIKYRRSTTLSFANTSPTITAVGWGIQLPAVTLKANETTVAGRTITYSGTGCNVNNNGTVTGIQDAGATITASFAGDDTYAASSATYIITGTFHAALNETVIGNISITPNNATLDLLGTQDYSVPASVSATTRTCEQYKEFACPTGAFYSYASNNNWQYTLTKPTVNENTGATVNLTRVNWTYSGGQGQYFQPTATNNKVTLTRTEQKTDHDQVFTITANAEYGTANKTATAIVKIPKTVVDLTDLRSGDAINLRKGQSASVEGHYTWEPNYESAGEAYKNFTYTSNNTNIATVDGDGYVTAVNFGTTTITVKSKKLNGDDGFSCNITVNVKVPTPTIKIRGNEVSFECEEPGVTFRYTTTGADPTVSSGTEWIGSAITNIAVGSTIKVIAVKNGASSDVASDVMRTPHVVYLRLAGAQGNRTGSSAANAVGTWADAFAKLGYGPNAAYLREQWRTHGADANTRNMASNAVFNNATFTSTVDNNIIYLVGDVSESQFSTLMGVTQSDPTSEYNLMYRVITSGFFKPVTISGKYANSNSNPEKYARISLTAGNSYTLNEDMRFEYVEFYGNNGTTSTDFKLAYYDLEMGEGIITKNFMSTKDFSTYHHGYAQGVTNAAHFMFYGGLTCDKRFGTSPAGAYNFDYYLPHPSGYKITIRSGFFSTISPGGTQWQNTTTLNGTMGSPNTPVKCTITIDIDHKWNDDHQSGVLGKTANGNPDCDVAVVIAGTHEGAMYGDVDIIVKSGRIDRVVNGTFGANNFVSNHPADSYFGRANILIDPREPSSTEKTNYPNKNSMVVIRELYGGGLGRFKSDSDKNNQSSTYFYGKSSVTINGGTFKSAIYASGAGGVNGVGDANHHTNDAKLPYLNNGALTYGTWTQYNAGTELGITCHKGRPDINKPDFHTNDNQIEETIYLADTKANIEIHGGVFGSSTAPIEGIFGGGYGFVDRELINYNNSCKPNTRAGAIFAAAGQTASSVTIDGNAEIYGNIYGAGRGDNRYKNARITYNNDDYTQLGQVSGNVELTIAGNAKIHGNIYGAGQGIEGYANMARLYGNTTVTIGENAVIDGDVYGGGQNGTVDKNNNNYGNTEVNIGGGRVKQDVYGGGALANVSGNTVVNLTAGQVDRDVYGGGLGRTTGTAIAALVNGNATTTLNGSIIGGSIFGANNVNGTPKGHVFVDIKKTTARADQDDDAYHVPAVYGGGNMAAYEPTSSDDYAEVLVEGCDNSIEYVYGGGNAASVPATDVTIWGGEINYVFGGGNGAGVGNPGANVGFKADNTTPYDPGTATTKIYGGTINNVYGGSNSKGLIRKGISLTIESKAAPDKSACPIDLGDVYGGGNEAASCAGNLSIGCLGEGSIDNVYGGANKANVTGDIVLNITGGNIGNVFGGNNTSGSINGTITVIVDWEDGCSNNHLDNVYGAGNLAKYVVPGEDKDFPKVFIRNATIDENVFGGGKGDKTGADPTKGQVTGNPQVKIGVSDGEDAAHNATLNSHQVTIMNSVYGGGDAAPVTGNPSVIIDGSRISGTTSALFKGDYPSGIHIVEFVFGGGLGNTAVINGSTYVEISGKTSIGKNVYGGGNGGAILGNTHVVIE